MNSSQIIYIMLYAHRSGNTKTGFITVYSRRSTTDSLVTSDPAVITIHLHEPAIESSEQARQVIIQIILPKYANNFGRWAIYTKEKYGFTGCCSLNYLSESEETDLSNRFLPAAWGKGYITQAASHILSGDFSTLHLKEIFGKAHIENTASINVQKKRHAIH